MTETGFNERVREEADLKQYRTFRTDITKVKEAGVAIYVHHMLEKRQITEKSHYKCMLIAVNVPAIITINLVSYRPPKSKLNDFNICSLSLAVLSLQLICYNCFTLKITFIVCSFLPILQNVSQILFHIAARSCFIRFLRSLPIPVTKFSIRPVGILTATNLHLLFQISKKERENNDINR